MDSLQINDSYGDILTLSETYDKAHIKIDPGAYTEPDQFQPEVMLTYHQVQELYLWAREFLQNANPDRTNAREKEEDTTFGVLVGGERETPRDVRVTVNVRIGDKEFEETYGN